MKGTRIYYHGDMANQGGFGTITEAIPANKYAPEQVKVKMDDGREFTIFSSMIEGEYKGHGGTRFVTEEAYKKWRQEKLEQLKKSIGK